MFFLPESFHLLLPTHLNTTATVLQLQEDSYSFNLAHSKIFERGGASAPKAPPLNPPLVIPNIFRSQNFKMWQVFHKHSNFCVMLQKLTLV